MYTEKYEDTAAQFIMVLLELVEGKSEKLDDQFWRKSSYENYSEFALHVTVVLQ